LPAFYRAVRGSRDVQDLDPEGRKRLRPDEKTGDCLKKGPFRGMLEARAGPIPARHRLPPPGSLE